MSPREQRRALRRSARFRDVDHRKEKLMALADIIRGRRENAEEAHAHSLECIARKCDKHGDNAFLQYLVSVVACWRHNPPHATCNALEKIRALIGGDDEECQRARTVLRELPKILLEILPVLNYSDTEEHLLLLTLACLRYTTKGDRLNINNATEAGGMDIVREILERHQHSGDVQEHALLVYRSLTFNRDDNQRDVIRKGILSLAIKAMRSFADHVGVQAAGCMLIQNITWLVEENRGLVESNGGLFMSTNCGIWGSRLGYAQSVDCHVPCPRQQTAIFAAMQAHKSSTEVQKWGCGALQNLACNVQAGPRQIRMGVVEMTLAAMENCANDAIVQTYGLGVLRNLSFLKENRRRVAKSGAIECALRSMRQHMNRYDVLSSACSFFFNTVIEEADNVKLALSQDGILPILFQAKEAHLTEPKIADKVHALLDQLMRASPGPYIDPGTYTSSIEPYTLAELAAKVVASSSLKDLGVRSQAELEASLFDNCATLVQHARPCDRLECTKSAITTHELALPHHLHYAGGWSLLRLCSRACVRKSCQSEPGAAATVRAQDIFVYQ